MWSDSWEPKLYVVICKETSSSHSVLISRSRKGVFWNYLCHPYSCHDVLNYLDAAFLKNRLGFPGQYFYPDIFFTNADKIYLQFVFCGADFILTMPCKVQETDYSMQGGSLKLLVLKHINFTYGHWYRPGMVYGQVLEFFFLHGSLQRAWQEVSLNFELKVRAADLHSWGSNKNQDDEKPFQLIQRKMI